MITVDNREKSYEILNGGATLIRPAAEPVREIPSNDLPSPSKFSRTTQSSSGAEMLMREKESERREKRKETWIGLSEGVCEEEKKR
ncbi:hypothetical protein L484_014520 [Morus notabilis]|uniref:Uncharacterized protein n=1 Tax=Morus notabilis TaxID=981085 RepID=W9S700_9ROSA|nr:hypothetical protein L484_014520 [Morus notabilis]